MWCWFKPVTQRTWRINPYQRSPELNEGDEGRRIVTKTLLYYILERKVLGPSVGVDAPPTLRVTTTTSTCRFPVLCCCHSDQGRILCSCKALLWLQTAGQCVSSTTLCVCIYVNAWMCGRLRSYETETAAHTNRNVSSDSLAVLSRGEK